MARVFSIVLVIAGLAAPAAALAGVERLYVLHCGRANIADLSRWTPGANEGLAAQFANGCYLIRHRRGLLLWETGVADAIADKPDGIAVLDGLITLFRDATLADQLAALGVAPNDIDLVVISHSHGDHTGNLALFADTTVVMQRKEYDAAYAGKDAPFGPRQKMILLDGDWDVFGDGSVTVLSTPGHTAGHQSLLVKLANTGAVLLSGDAAHLKLSWDKRYVPTFNFDKDQTLASMDRLAALKTRHGAQLWINHDKAQIEGLKHAPDYYD